MEIARSGQGEAVDLELKGRLDEYWARHLARALEEIIGEGARQMRLNLSDVTYLGSAGVGVLVKFHQQLVGARGSLAVSIASPPVKRVLEMAKLGDVLVAEAASPPAPKPAEIPPDRQAPRASVETPAAGPWMTAEAISRDAALRCGVLGTPDALLGCLVEEKHSRKIRLPDATFAVGLGAFGRTFDECNGRFGDFVAVAGAAAYQPAYGSNVPDSVLASGAFVPELIVLCGIQCQGTFSHLARFEGTSLADVVGACLDVAQTDVAGIVLLAETAEPLPALILAAGVAARAECDDLAGMLRSLGKAPYPAGCFHAARFGYRRIEQYGSDLEAAAATLFKTESIRSVARLGEDEPQFVCGCCWVGRISEITAEKK